MDLIFHRFQSQLGPNSYRFECQHDPKSHPKASHDRSLKPLYLQSADVLDKPLFTMRNGPRATLHWPQNSSKIDSNRYLDLPCFSRPPKSHFKLQNVSTWPQHGSAPTWAQHVSIWEGSGGCKTCQSRPWSPTCQPRPHIAPPRCLQGRILVDVGLMLERFSAGVWLISSSIFWC